MSLYGLDTIHLAFEADIHEYYVGCILFYACDCPFSRRHGISNLVSEIPQGDRVDATIWE